MELEVQQELELPPTLELGGQQKMEPSLELPPLGLEMQQELELQLGTLLLDVELGLEQLLMELELWLETQLLGLKLGPELLLGELETPPGMEVGRELELQLEVLLFIMEV